MMVDPCVSPLLLLSPQTRRFLQLHLLLGLVRRHDAEDLKPALLAQHLVCEIN